LVATDAMAFYLCKIVWPMHLCVDYGHGPQSIWDNRMIFWTWVLPAVIAIALWRWKNRIANTAAAIFLLPLIPVLGFVGFEFQQISTTADHYLYLPMLGVAILATLLLTRITSRWKYPSTGAILIALCVRSIFAEPVWQNTRTLFLHTLEVNPDSVVSTDTLGFFAGREARRTGDPTESKKKFDESISWYQQSLQKQPNSVPSIFNLALDYQAIGDNKTAMQLMHRIVEVQPLLQPGLRVDPMDLAQRLYDFPDLPEAMNYLDQILASDPTNRNAMVLRLKIIHRLGQQQSDRPR
jgi:protein O-mannosyl-transferase